MTIRTVATLLSIEFVPFLRNRNFQPRTVARARLEHQIATNGPNSFLDDRRTAVQIVKFGKRQPAGELKPTTIIVDYQLPQAILCAKPDIDRPGPTMLSNIHQAFLHYPG